MTLQGQQDSSAHVCRSEDLSSGSHLLQTTSVYVAISFSQTSRKLSLFFQKDLFPPKVLSDWVRSTEVN